MYRQFISQAERDEIIAGAAHDPENRPPHCNETSFHEPGVCAFCDGYYRRNPAFHPAAYVPPEANGWGGNMAPIVDDEQAAAEQTTFERLMERITSTVRRED